MEIYCTKKRIDNPYSICTRILVMGLPISSMIIGRLKNLLTLSGLQSPPPLSTHRKVSALIRNEQWHLTEPA